MKVYIVFYDMFDSSIKNIYNTEELARANCDGDGECYAEFKVIEKDNIDRVENRLIDLIKGLELRVAEVERNQRIL